MADLTGDSLTFDRKEKEKRALFMRERLEIPLPLADDEVRIIIDLLEVVRAIGGYRSRDVRAGFHEGGKRVDAGIARVGQERIVDDGTAAHGIGDRRFCRKLLDEETVVEDLSRVVAEDEDRTCILDAFAQEVDIEGREGMSSEVLEDVFERDLIRDAIVDDVRRRSEAHRHGEGIG